MFDRRSGNLSHRLYDEALALRMRPFADSAHNFPRLIRDVSRTLGKEARLEIVGEATQVDRDILEKLEAPLNHLLRNALDHGLESPDERTAAGKPREGTIWLEARHSAGMLLITVRDDGRGIDVESVRRAVVAKKLTNAETAAKLIDSELLEFLFLPGFSMKDSVTEISGRGVGLDVVQVTMKQLRGTLRTSSELGRGTSIQLQLPLTLSVLRALVVEIAGEPYGIPLAAITRTLKLGKDRIESLEGRQHFTFEDQRVGLVTAHQVFEKNERAVSSDELPVVIVGERDNRYGFVVDRFLGERELVVQPLDPRLGKIKDISAGALTDDGTPLLIIDIEDVVRSIEKLSATGRLTLVQHQSSQPGSARRRKRVLVVDDSLTVRELERKLLEARGYEVEIAVDGMDGWNALRTGEHDLVITDVDMPRLDGIELVSLIRKDPNLKSKPVMIVSYKDREEDRVRGLEAGADYYLTKGSFHDETLISSVADLIGEP
jgi:two-component system sensor histidine kinase and response regulator WspE